MVVSGSTFRRIPLDLQAVFVASNQGEEVHTTPASKSAIKVFRYIWGGITGRSSSTEEQQQQTQVKRKLTRQASTRIRQTAPSSVVPAPAPAAAPPKAEPAPTPAAPTPAPQQTPQQWLTATLAARGYHTTPTRTLDTAYHTPATKLQLASYNAKSVQLATKTAANDAANLTALRDMLYCGISPNACNVYGETLLHKACRLGHAHILATFVEYGAEVRVCDEQGRTLLHDACWAARPAWRTVAFLLKLDPGMVLLADCRGSCPFDYIRKDDAAVWMTFLQRNVDAFWPVITTPQQYGTPGSRPMHDPVNALTVNLAEMVAEGRLTPREALQCMHQKLDEENDGDDAMEDDEDDSDYEEDEDASMGSCSDDSGDYSSSWESESSSDQSLEDMQLLQELGVMGG